jgi:hypothetical protein
MVYSGQVSKEKDKKAIGSAFTQRLRQLSVEKAGGAEGFKVFGDGRKAKKIKKIQSRYRYL